MKSIIRSTFTVLSLYLLINGLVIGFPFELSNQVLNTIVLIIYLLLVSLLIFLVGRQLIYKLNDNLLNGLLKKILFLLILSYLVYGLEKVFTNKTDWVDMKIYLQKNETIVKQNQRDNYSNLSNNFRFRRILYEFNKKNRISIKWSDSKMHGKWNIYDINKDTTYIKDFGEE